MQSTLHALVLGTALVLGNSAAVAATPPPSTPTSTWEDVKSWTHDKKKDAVAAGKKMMAATDRQMKDMQAQAKKSGTETSEAHKKNMAELAAKKKAAAAELAKLEKAGATAWTGTRDAFAAAYKDLSESSQKAAPAK